MSKRFEFSTAGRIIFGAGSLRELPPIAKELGRRALLVTGNNQERVSPLIQSLNAERLDYSIFRVSGEPTTELVMDGVAQGQKEQVDFVIGFGGGSVIDAAKAIAGLLTNPGPLQQYLEVIGQGKPLSHPALPYIAVPTSAGPGTEVTRNAVLTSRAHGVKVSLRSRYLLPTVAIVDPEMTYALPPALTASTGLDALTQLIEPYVCTRANSLTDVICLEGMRRVGRSLWKAYTNGGDTNARTDMSLASLYGGLALANAGLGAVHGFAGPIGGMFQAPHGAVCAALLPHVMEVNLRACIRERLPDVLTRFDELASALTGNPKAKGTDGVAWVKDLVAQLRIPSLSHYGITSREVQALCEKAKAASSMKANPVQLSENELKEILERAL